MNPLRNRAALLAAAAALALGSAGMVGVAQARHGQDDPVGHDAGDDHGGHHGQAARHRANDSRRGDARRGRHQRDRAGAARQGADDPAGHDAGDDHGGR